MRSAPLPWMLGLAFSSALLLGPDPLRAEAGLGFSRGLFDLTRDRETAEVGLDVFFAEVGWRIRPHVGIGLTGDSASFFHFGARRDLSLGGSRWYLVPSFSVSIFHEGDGKSLGGALEFRSGLDLHFEFEGGWRMGAGIYHLSNSSIFDQNPGANSLLVRVVSPPWKRKRQQPTARKLNPTRSRWSQTWP